MTLYEMIKITCEVNYILLEERMFRLKRELCNSNIRSLGHRFTHTHVSTRHSIIGFSLTATEFLYFTIGPRVTLFILLSFTLDTKSMINPKFLGYSF